LEHCITSLTAIYPPKSGYSPKGNRGWRQKRQPGFILAPGQQISGLIGLKGLPARSRTGSGPPPGLRDILGPTPGYFKEV
jgi:hypothetical protein